jgi:hypothetical protein
MVGAVCNRTGSIKARAVANRTYDIFSISRNKLEEDHPCVNKQKPDGNYH